MIPSLETWTRATYWFSAACRVVAVCLVLSWLFQYASLLITVLQEMLSNDQTAMSLVDVLGPGLPFTVMRILAASFLWFVPDHIAPLIMRWQIPACPACKRRFPSGVPARCVCGAELRCRQAVPSTPAPSTAMPNELASVHDSGGGAQ